MELFLVFIVLVVALAFTYTNGFHDTANAIATSVATKVLTPRQAILLSTIFNLIGALMGTAVAKTVGQGLVDTQLINQMTILCALLAAVGWNLFTWWLGLPSSSSHALIGGLCGAALASAHGNWAAIIWSKRTGIDAATGEAVHLAFFKSEGMWPKVIAPMFLAPLCGLTAGFIVMGILYVLLRNWRPHTVNRLFGRFQLLSASWMSLEHGRNDAQKNMGIIALTLVIATKAGSLDTLPPWLAFLRTPEFTVALWLKLVCAVVIAFGTAAGGWKIIHTMGKGVMKMQTIHGFAAQATAAGVIGVATEFGIPLSTTQVISSAIMGVGASKRLSAVKWMLVERMVWAWILTLPATALVAFVLVWFGNAAGMMHVAAH
jgi:PiT family inorganic phosphate transporter